MVVTWRTVFPSVVLAAKPQLFSFSLFAAWIGKEILARVETIYHRAQLRDNSISVLREIQQNSQSAVFVQQQYQRQTHTHAHANTRLYAQTPVSTRWLNDCTCTLSGGSVWCESINCTNGSYPCLAPTFPQLKSLTLLSALPTVPMGDVILATKVTVINIFPPRHFLSIYSQYVSPFNLVHTRLKLVSERFLSGSSSRGALTVSAG